VAIQLGLPRPAFRNVDWWSWYVFGELDQLVLDLEGAEGLEGLEFREVHECVS
jgi:hypothetical protein